MNPLEGSDDPFDDPLQSISAASTSSRPIPLGTASAGHLQDSGLSLTPTAAWPSPKPSRDASQNRAPSLTKGTIEEVCEACSQGDLLLLEDLLNANEPNTFTLINSTGKTGLTPLHKAAARGRTDIIALLLDKGAMILDSSGETPVHLAALKGHLHALQALIDFGGRDAAEAQDSDGWTPLHNSCSQGFLDCVRYLVEDVGVHVDALSKAHYTPLMNAAGKGHLPVVNYLLSKRLANPMLRSLYGETAYDIAAVSEVYICEILAQNEAALWSEKQASQPTDERMPYNPLALHVSCHVMLHENQRLDLRLTSLGHRASFTSSAISKNDHRSPFTLPPSYDGLNPTEFHLPVYRPDLGLPTSSNPFQVVLPSVALSFAAQLQKKRPDHSRARPSNSHRAASRSVSGMSALSEGTSAVSDSSYFAANAALPITVSTERAWFWMTDWFIDYSLPRVDPEHGWEYARSFDDPPDAWTPEPPPDLQRLMEQSTAPLSSSSTNRWVRRRRWIRVMRRRLDRPGLPFADLDDPETVLSPNTSDGRSEQELPDLNAPDEADYVARARFKAGVHHRLASRDLDGSSVRSGKARQEAGKAEARKLVLRLESAISELRIGLLADEDVDRVQQASALLETYAARLEEVKAQTPLDDAVEDAEDQPFVYSAQPTADASTPTRDYFTHPGASTSQRPPDLTPDLRLASDFRVPTQDSPIVRVTNSMPTAISALPRWEPDASVDQCRRCSMPFSFLRRRHHCRKCGRVVCNACSSTQDQLDPAEVVLDPNADLLTRLSVASLKTHRTCMPCHEEVIARSNRPIGSPSGIPVDSDLLTAVFDPASQAPDSPLASSVASEQSVLTECPVCGFKLSSLVNQLDQEAHVRNCLNSGRSSAIQSHRYLVFKLGESPLVGQECIICFEEFVIGANVARLICLCYFHAECIKSWLKRSHGCPLHQRE